MNNIESNSSTVNPIEFIEEEITYVGKTIDSDIILPDGITDTLIKGIYNTGDRLITYEGKEITISNISKKLDKPSYGKKYCLNNGDIFYLSSAVKTQIYKNDGDVILYQEGIVGNIYEITMNDNGIILISGSKGLFSLDDGNLKKEKGGAMSGISDTYLNSLTLDNNGNIYYLEENNGIYYISINGSSIKLDKIKFLAKGTQPSFKLGDNGKIQINFYKKSDDNEGFDKIYQEYEIDTDLDAIVDKQNEDLKRKNDEKMLFDSIENEGLTIEDVIQLVNDKKSNESTIQEVSGKLDSSKITLEQAELREDGLKKEIVEKDRAIEEKDNIISKIKEILDGLSSVFGKRILNDDSKKEIELLIK